MMKIIHRITGLILFAAALASGLFLFAASLSVSWWRVFADALIGYRLYALTAGAALIVLSMLYSLSGVRRGRKREKYLSYDSAEGTTSISTQAIEDYIARLAPEFPSVMKMRPVVVPMRRAIDIAVELRVKAGPQIHEVCELMQSRIREAMSNGLGISDIRRVEVTVKEIAAEHKPS